VPLRNYSLADVKVDYKLATVVEGMMFVSKFVLIFAII